MSDPLAYPSLTVHTRECPTDNLVLSGQLKKFYGNLTAETAIREVTSVEMSGDNRNPIPSSVEIHCELRSGVL